MSGRCKVPVAVVAGTIVGVGGSQVAFAYELFDGCHYVTPTLKWKPALKSQTYLDEAQATAWAWTSTSTPISLTQASSGANVTLASGNWGSTEHDGYMRMNDGGPWYCGASGHWDQGTIAWLNTYYTDGYSSTKKKSVWVHEVGHSLGLAHSGEGAACSVIPIMAPETSDRYGRCSKSTPQTDDVNGINFLY
ncbi:matrixin family metalloprotease [Knoellia sinensis]|uniref:matrixin family metalloprotease n=1 Tax=Knoellia sinensis TaxID=136100 RepID=UPI0012EC9629